MLLNSLLKKKKDETENCVIEISTMYLKFISMRLPEDTAPFIC